MQTIDVYDSSGNTISNLVQWDKDVYVYINHPDITSSYTVHFFNVNSKEAYVVASTYAEGILKAKIPNNLLMEPLAITGYVNVFKSGEQKSLYCFKIGMRNKPMPQSYVHVDTPDWLTFDEVMSECREYADSASNSEKAAKNSATLSRSYAVGDTGTRVNEVQDNSKYYCEQSNKHANESEKSATESKEARDASNESANDAERYAGEASESATQVAKDAKQVADDRKTVEDTIKNSLLDNASDILEQVKSYFERAEELYRSCTIVCDGETPAKRVVTIVEIDCHTPQRRSTGYYGVDFDGQTPAMRLLGE